LDHRVFLGIELVVSLAFVHGLVGGGQKGVDCGTVGKSGDANGASNANVASREGEWSAERALEPVGEAAHVVIVREIFNDDDEFVAANPADQVSGAQDVADPARRGGEEFITGLMAKTVVDGLEVVEVEEQHGKTFRRASLAIDGTGEVFDDSPPVGQSGEHIDLRKPA
jgi:hypothetical protein